MSKKEIREGQLFSRTYLEHGEPTRDSKRFRTRIQAYFNEVLAEHIEVNLANLIGSQLGVTVAWHQGYLNFQDFFSNAELRDILDTISLITKLLQMESGEGAKLWMEFVKDVFEEENVGYRIDPKGGVHYLVDEEFERNRVSAIASITSPKYAAVMRALELAFSALDARSINTKTAVRDTFEALEIVIKLLTNSNKNLDEKLVKNELAALLRKLPEYTEPSGASTIGKFIESLADWVNAAHPYRHGQKTEKLVAPSLTSAVLFLSTGAAYIRWLVDQLGTTDN
jgi:hypothetical protein